MSNCAQMLCIIFAFVSLFLNSTGSRLHPGLHASAPEKQLACDSFKLKMNDCSAYIKRHSRMAEPGTSCCSGVMEVWKVDSTCADEVLMSIVNLRHVNKTRAAHVSSSCGFPHIFIDKYLARLLEARVDKAKEDRAKKRQDKEHQDMVNKAAVDQAAADQAKVDKAEADKAKAYTGMYVAIAVAGVAGVIVIAGIIVAVCCLCYF